MKRLMLVVPIVAATALLPHRAGAQETCPAFRELAEASVPGTVGNRDVMTRLLNVRVGPQLSQNFDAAAVEKAVGDQLQPDAACRREGPAPCFFRNRATGSVMQRDLLDGRVTYLNPSRRFDAARGIDNPVTNAEALRIAMAGINGFGVPPAEKGPPIVRTLMAATQDAPRRTKTQVLRAEVHVNVQRHVAGTPVFASRVVAAVSAGDQIARLYVNWPDFSIAPGFGPGDTRARPTVVDDVVERLTTDNPCGSIGHVLSHIAYVPLHLTDPLDEDNEGPKGTDQGGFVPALVVFAVPSEPGEGQPHLAEQQFVVPLLSQAAESPR
jgi:hypothetical protein